MIRLGDGLPSHAYQSSSPLTRSSQEYAAAVAGLGAGWHIHMLGEQVLPPLSGLLR